MNILVWVGVVVGFAGFPLIILFNAMLIPRSLRAYVVVAALACIVVPAVSVITSTEEFMVLYTVTIVPIVGYFLAKFKVAKADDTRQFRIVSLPPNTTRFAAAAALMLIVVGAYLCANRYYVIASRPSEPRTIVFDKWTGNLIRK